MAPNPSRSLAALCLLAALSACGGPRTHLLVGEPSLRPYRDLSVVATTTTTEMDEAAVRVFAQVASRSMPTTTTTTAPPLPTTTAPARVSPVARPAAPDPPQPGPSAVQAADVDGMPRTLRRIAGCESGNGPDGPIDWTARNRSSTASGGFQDLDGTYQQWAVRFRDDVIDETGADPTGWARAMDAPAVVQLKVNLHAYLEDGAGPWASSRGCWAG